MNICTSSTLNTPAQVFSGLIQVDVSWVLSFLQRSDWQHQDHLSNSLTTTTEGKTGGEERKSYTGAENVGAGFMLFFLLRPLRLTFPVYSFSCSYFFLIIAFVCLERFQICRPVSIHMPVLDHRWTLNWPTCLWFEHLGSHVISLWKFTVVMNLKCQQEDKKFLPSCLDECVWFLFEICSVWLWIFHLSM